MKGVPRVVLVHGCFGLCQEEARGNGEDEEQHRVKTTGAREREMPRFQTRVTSFTECLSLLNLECVPERAGEHETPGGQSAVLRLLAPPCARPRRRGSTRSLKRGSATGLIPAAPHTVLLRALIQYLRPKSGVVLLTVGAAFEGVLVSQRNDPGRRSAVDARQVLLHPGEHVVHAVAAVRKKIADVAMLTVCARPWVKECHCGLFEKLRQLFEA